MNNVIEITSAEFDQKVLRSPVPVVVDFFADWCGPCRLLAPILQDLASELQDQVAVYKVDAVENIELATRLGITALPTVSVFKDGYEVARLVGLQNRERLLDAVRGR
jgi:thioredoxin 1